MRGQPQVGFRSRAKPRFAVLHEWVPVVHATSMSRPARCTSAPASTCEVELAAGSLRGYGSCWICGGMQWGRRMQCVTPA